MALADADSKQWQPLMDLIVSLPPPLIWLLTVRRGLALRLRV